MSKMNKADLKAKIEWEGGVAAALTYGIRAAEIADPKLAELWTEALTINAELESVIAEITQELRNA